MPAKKKLSNGRTITTKTITFRCAECNQGIFAERYPGRAPRYCDICGPKVAAKRARMRKRKQRAKAAAAKQPIKAAPSIEDMRQKAKRRERWTHIADHLRKHKESRSAAVLADFFPGTTAEELDQMVSEGVIASAGPCRYTAVPQKRSAR